MKADMVILDDLIQENGQPEWETFVDPALGEDQTIYTLQHENGMIMTNQQPGGWVETKDGSFVSVEYAKSLNRAGRRKQGIRL